MKRFFVLYLLTTSLLSFSAEAAKSSLTIAIIQEWSTFNPVTSQLASNQALFPFIIRYMVKRSVDGGVVADVAEKIPTLDSKNSALWIIKKNAKWADGQNITCADWYLGWQAGLNPKVSVEARSTYEKITKIEWSEKTPQNCNVTYATNDWTFDRDLPPFLPSHVEKSVYEKNKTEAEGYDRNTVYINGVTNNALYNGPYYVSEFKLGSHVIFTRNENFFGTKPKIAQIIVKHISDTSALRANIMSGQINAISAVGFPPDTAFLFDEDFKSSKLPYVVRFQNSGIFQGIYFNLDNEILKDIKVREALSRTINKEQIVKAFFSNKLQTAESILSPQHPAYTSKAAIYSKDKAVKLLDEAGWKMGPNRVRKKNGKTLSLVFKTSAGLKVLENIQIYVCEQFKSVGVECIIKNEPPRTLLGQSVPHGEFDLAMYGQPIPADSSLTGYFSSKDIPTAKNSWAGGNSIRLNSKELDQLLNDFDKENNKQKRNAIVKKIENFLQKNYSMIPIYHRREAVVIPKGLSGVLDSYEGTAFTDPEKWILN
ncbi:peptide ABC transporter substrate-binding protein [bacterium]|nr:peptide ABC transporter substrate-binding protein [bacterium]